VLGVGWVVGVVNVGAVVGAGAGVVDVVGTGEVVGKVGVVCGEEALLSLPHAAMMIVISAVRTI
jgi:hypothetical protein